MAVGTSREGLAAKLWLCCAVLLAAGLIGARPAAAAPPANDNFASAQTITGTSGVAVSGTNVQATKQAGEPNHAGDPGGASVWYVWTAPTTDIYRVNTCGGSTNFDTLLAVYTGSAVGSLTRVVSNEDAIGCGGESRVWFHATSGTTYRIAVDGTTFGGGEPVDTGAIDLRLDRDISGPLNDSFSSPNTLSGKDDYDINSDVGATKQTGEPAHAGNAGGASDWYVWTAPASGPTSIDTCYAEFDTLLGVYIGNAVNSLTPVASSDDDCGDGGGSYVEFDAVQGTTYRIAVDGSNAGPDKPALGVFMIYLYQAQPPANDDFANAQVISGSNLNVSGSTIDADSEPGEPSGFADGPLNSVWYAWTAPTSGQLAIDTCNSNFDTVLTLFTGNALNALTRVASNDQASNCGFGGSKLIVNVNGGTTYRIAVDGYYDAGDFQLRLLLSGSALAQKDSKAPNAKITKVKVDSEHGKATLTFGSNEAGSKYKCKLDRRAYKSCHSPKTFRHLDAGKHKVKVLATDKAGNTDPTPAVKKFKIEG